MARQYNRIYVGVKMDESREAFRGFNPTLVTHPQYRYTVGPFRTKAAADLWLENGQAQPFPSVNAAERYVKLLTA